MPPSIPLATYRLQLTADFNFDKAAEVVPYLKALGITHLYASPFMKARQGSTHGYDVVDHTKLNPELGGEAGFERLSAALQKHDLGLILDFVPNHVGVHFADNPWWLDMLEWGPASPHASAFDIDWEQLPYRKRGGVLLPILGSSYGEALERGEIELRYDAGEGSFSCWYYEHRLPIAPERYGEVLRMIVRQAGAEDSDTGQRILALASHYRGLRHPNRQEAPQFKAELKAIGGGAEIIRKGLSAYRAGIEHAAETLALHHLLERQHYRLGHWRLASSDINYRRFFDINSLAGLRVEETATFETAHRLVKQLIAEGKLQGLRLDHIDGLRDPQQYFQRLRRLIREAHGGEATPFYVVVEKILGADETLRHFAGIHGTTGYEWMNALAHLLVDGKGLEALDEVWRQVSNQPPRLEPLLKAAKRRVLETLLTSEFTVLVRLLARIASGHYSTRDFSADSLRQALELYVLHFPVYRTYLTSAGPTANDRALIEITIARARAEWYAADEGIFDFLRDALTLDLIKPGRPPHSAPRVRRFALKLQQFTGPLMAKSLEDTAFYRYHRLLALNEVGGDPAAKALSVADFHQMMRTRMREWPHGMTATATHDTKRGEDARARLMALSEIPGEWTSAVARWKVTNAPHLALDGEMRAPSAAMEYMLYQTLLGAWSLEGPDAAFVERVQAYALKAAREGKEQTSWLNPHTTYEAGLKGFIERILDPSRSREFLDSVAAIARRVALLGALDSLSQLTLKTTLPGVPDFYQGTELWDLSLVDPDNRRPVDFAVRAHLLPTLQAPDWAALTENWGNGYLKFAWTAHLLRLRNELADVFTHGDYQPLEASGPSHDHVVAFARRRGSDAAIVVVARHFAGFTDGGRAWPRAEAFEGAVNLSGYAVDGVKAGAGELPLSGLFKHLPATVLKARLTAAARPARKRVAA
ncbi:MAG TPA: malto-oligosyltrehalose synthase [Bradyrhizobium sp.]|uniref:malto-oligosyltrehalose synthase n=1 Tax=Bradyrhizobium sp. TaxID=376 RepID=UPI002C4A0854|nr:malto-oligosyltrehalose synthase [Bradyrhizobium sp.]HLZ05846.1 malto-oligosyltrehalose synthase [Bradyrhizobium sp.]